MNAPRFRVIGNMDDQFHTAVSWEVQAIQDALASLAMPVSDVRSAHRERQIASLKVSADTVAKYAGQLQQLASHLSSVCEKHVTGSKS